MSEGFAQSPQLAELAQLPSSDPRRQGLEASLSRMEAAERDHWLGVLQETDHLYAQTADVSLPANLQGRLIQIADEPRRFSVWQRLLQAKLSGPTVAFAGLAAIVLVAVAGYLMWQSAPRLAPVVHPLDQQIAARVALDAETAGADAALQINSSDPAAVQAALGAHSYSFPVMMLKPRQPLMLVGGGVARVSGTPAVFTRWKSASANYTLLEFDGKAIGMPGQFLRTMQSPDAHSRVVLWPGPGAACTWALVMDETDSADPFSSGY